MQIFKIRSDARRTGCRVISSTSTRDEQEDRYVNLWKGYCGDE